jgi:hypothetical protein
MEPNAASPHNIVSLDDYRKRKRRAQERAASQQLVESLYASGLVKRPETKAPIA